MGVTTTFGKVALFSRSTVSRGWAPQDIADLYRIRDQLTRFGFPVVVHTGQSDEGDPWAVFERDGTDEVVVHVARIDKELVIVDVVRNRTHRGNDFRSLSDKLLDEAPLALPRPEDRGNVVLHPRMVMTAFVAAAFVVSEFANPSVAEAATLEAGSDDLPEDKAADAKALVFWGKQDGDLVGKLLGRDSALGAHTLPLLGLGSLAASFAALSNHLGFDTSEDDLAQRDVADAEASVPQDVVLNVFRAEPLLFDDILIAQDHGLDVQKSLDISVTQAQSNKKDAMFENSKPSPASATDEDVIVSISVDDMQAHTHNQQDFTTHAMIFDNSLEDQEFEFSVVVPADQSSAAERTPEGPNLDTAEILDRVAASVSILDQSYLPKADFGGDPDGAIVIELSEFSASFVDSEAVSGNSPTFTKAESSQSSDELMDFSPSGESLERYQLASDLSENIALSSDAYNVVVYAGGDVVVSGFSLGRDRIVFLENITPPDWLSSVEIVGSDVVLFGQDGSVTLSDAVATFV
jgi:hypothetical protein